MRRTQLYLDDQLWNALNVQARMQKTTMSDLVREAVREKYLGNREKRVKAMQDFVGSRKSKTTQLYAVEEVRVLRRGGRLARLGTV